ncbi:MAG: thioredoxin domain-containing protein [Nanoarchaeota archaeon]|jgi:protein-disulfide isomerase|nr:thioredoxin domain-containing protein [Nanoarchaeota archaeon]
MTKETIEIKKSTLTSGAITILVILLAISMFTGGFGIGDENIAANAVAVPTAPAAAPNAPTAPVKVDMKTILDDDAVEGDENAPVTIVEFSDYECPFCARFYDQTLGQIRENYVDTGKVKIIFRDYPLGFHQNAQKAAEAAECAGEQDKYYDMHNQIFENGVEGGVDTFKQYAKDIGLDSGKFDTCLDSGAMAAEVAKDLADGQAAGVQGTPAFFVNGEFISGAQPYTVFETAINNALA